MDLNYFFGRFHIVLVHLPIGLLLLAVVMQLLSRNERFKNLETAISISLFLGTISAILSAGCGWLLANEGVYADQTLFLHRWAGISVAVVAGICWLVKTNRIAIGKKGIPFLMIILALLIFYTGHLGGNLTHGPGYLLKHAPATLKSIFGAESKSTIIKFQISNPDSTIVFNDLLLPVLKEKCGDCHDDKNTKGGLVLTTREGFLEGGDHEEIVVSGNAFESKIFERVTLPKKDERFMPPKGEVLSYDQIRLLEWWINTGADFGKKVSEYDLPKDIEMLLANNYGLEMEPKSFIETLEVSPISDAVFQKIQAQNFKITRLAANNNLLEISAKQGVKNITIEAFKTLLDAKEQITWLNLSNLEISDEHLLIIMNLSNLSRLRLEQTLVTDQGVKSLESLTHLESLNLYGTSITDQSIETFVKMPALKKIFLWQTKMSQEGLEKLKTSRPDLEVVGGLEFSK